MLLKLLLHLFKLFLAHAHGRKEDFFDVGEGLGKETDLLTQLFLPFDSLFVFESQRVDMAHVLFSVANTPVV